MEMLARKFEECPYGCTNGFLFDRNLRKRVPCPFCSERKKEMANEGKAVSETGDVGNLALMLGVPNDYVKAVLDYDSIVPDGERLYIEKDSIERQNKIVEDLYLGLTVGQLPDRSYCFGFGNKGRADKFAFPILAKAYMAGLSVAKFISCTDYNRMLVAMSQELDVFLSSDLVVMFICDGSTKADIAAAKGLMQSRALRAKPTIFATAWSIEACSILLGYWNDPSYMLACGVFLEYRTVRKEKHSFYINQLTGVENAVVSGDIDYTLESMTEKPSRRSEEGGKGMSMEELTKELFSPD